MERILPYNCDAKTAMQTGTAPMPRYWIFAHMILLPREGAMISAAYPAHQITIAAERKLVGRHPGAFPSCQDINAIKTQPAVTSASSTTARSVINKLSRR